MDIHIIVIHLLNVSSTIIWYCKLFFVIFRLILIAEKTTVYDHYPTPLINRLEKHFVLTSSVLAKWQLDVMEQLQEWAQAFSCVSGYGILS